MPVLLGEGLPFPSSVDLIGSKVLYLVLVSLGEVCIHYAAGFRTHLRLLCLFCYMLNIELVSAIESTFTLYFAVSNKLVLDDPWEASFSKVGTAPRKTHKSH